jgi:hypothetical protein
LLIETAKRNGRYGIVNVPEHFHNSLLYDGRLGFKFLNPEDQGVFERMVEDLGRDIREKGMAAVSWAISLRFVSCDGDEFVWEGHEQVLPFSEAMASYFARREYRAICQAAKGQAGHFAIKWDDAERYARLAAADQATMPESPW